MYDISIIGGGIIGLSTAYRLIRSNPHLKICILEKESEISLHQTGHNSGVIHSGIYYKPGSLKAKNCISGVEQLFKFCNKYNIKYEICGKVIVATQKNELHSLDLLYNRGKKNRINGLKKICKDELKELEPYAHGLSAIHCPGTGIVDYLKVSKKISEQLKNNCDLIFKKKVINIERDNSEIILFAENTEYRSKFLINCAGLFSDKVSELAGFERKVRIIPFRGEYYKLKENSKFLIKNLIYPVPNPAYPFLGVHFTRHINGSVEAGPNAVLAWAREGYRKTDFNLDDIYDYMTYPGFWKMAYKYWKTALGEYNRSIFKSQFVKSLQKLVPEIESKDIKSSPSGVRAQALGKNGSLIDDFVIKKTKNMIHVVNAPSPAATSCFAIGEKINELYKDSFN